ncbi:class I SAM-dependent methyltransferase [Roseicella frigidaeris]|nr:class I SAM-dependent methyltransferase [Roseicella frigidaeris]
MTTAESMMDAALAVSPAGLLHARATAPCLRLEARDPCRFIITTAWHEYSGDLSQGLVLQALRGAEGAPGSPICHSGNMLECRHRGRRLSLDVESHIVDFGIRRLPGRVVLFHESRFHRPEGLAGRLRPFARLRYEYAISAENPVLQLTVTLTAEPGLRLIAPRITTALDALSPAGARTAIRRLIAWGPGGKAATQPSGQTGAVTLHEGPARHLLLPEEPRYGGTAQACHLRLSDGHLLASVKGTPQADGMLHWLVLRYACPTLPRGGSMTIREERLRLDEASIDPTPDAAEQTIGGAVSVAIEAAREAEASWDAGGTAPDRRPASARIALTPPTGAAGETAALRGNIKLLGSALAQSRLAACASAEAPIGPQAIGLASRACCQADIEGDWLRHWCRVLGVAPRYHRKLWEDCTVPQMLWEAGMLEPGRRGLGFAVGREDLPALFASRGVEVLATDLDSADSRATAWTQTGQHADRLESLHRPRLLPEEGFRRRVQFRPVDMTAIPADLLQGEFDFVWSVCALEHLGSLEAGEAFVRTAMRCLRPGGIAVHTTEFNLDPTGPTVETGPTVLYQRRHLERLGESLAAAGHAMLPLRDPAGDRQLFDQLVDLPPYAHQGGPENSPHLRLVLAGHTVTSVALVIRAGGA